MKVERIDHLHIKVDDMKSVTSAFENVLGEKVLIEELSAGNGMKVSFNPFPNGIEIMEVVDDTKEMASLYSKAPQGVFAVSLKVPDIDKATTEMEAMGNTMLMRYDFGPVKEALFDTKNNCGVYIELIEFPGENILDVSDEASRGLDIKKAAD